MRSTQSEPLMGACGKVLDQIAREAGVQCIAVLRDDGLPRTPGSPQHSYVGVMLENIRTMVTALGRCVDALQRIDPAELP